MTWQTHCVAPAHDLLAPDGSEIRVLVRVTGGSMVHCTLQPGQATRAVRHRTVEEMWFCVAGAGQVWRRTEAASPPAEAQPEHPCEQVADLAPGVALSIPLGVAFQFRASGSRPLELVIATIPPWPGDAEAVAVDGLWEATLR